MITPAQRGDTATAAEVWSLCKPATADHCDLFKGLSPQGFGVYPEDAPEMAIKSSYYGGDEANDVSGMLVIPAMANGVPQTLQFYAAGELFTLPQGKLEGGYFALGNVETADRLYLVDDPTDAFGCVTATGETVVLTFDETNTRAVAETLQAAYPTKRLILVAATNVEEANKEWNDRYLGNIKKMARELNCGWCAPPAHVSFYELRHGLHKEITLKDVLNVPTTLRYKALTDADLAVAPSAPWLVHGVLPLNGLAALYGPSGSGKSFLALDLAGALASGAGRWFGHKIVQCPVTYCVLEDEAGQGQRVRAWMAHHEKPFPQGLQIIAQPINLLKRQDIDDLAETIVATGATAGMVIIDTLSRAAPGADENSAVAMGRIIEAVERLRARVGGLVLLVHHTGKDVAKGLRGHSSLFAALDGAIEVTGTSGVREWSVAKAKNAPTGDVYPFKLQSVPAAGDPNGIPPCVAVPDDSSRSVMKASLPRGGNQRLIFDALAPLFDDGTTGVAGAPAERRCIGMAIAVAAGAAALTCPTDRRNSRAKEAITGLITRGAFGCSGDWLWLV